MNLVWGLPRGPKTGGLSGLIETLKAEGLGDAVSSWIGTGETQPVSGEQMEHALGRERIQEIAQKVGAPKEQVSNGRTGC